MKPKPTPTPKTYAWTVKDKKINCYRSEANTCNVSALWETDALTSFHDAELAQATTEINAILDEIAEGNRDPERELAFIQFKDRHFLVWTHHGAVGPHDDDGTIRRTLRLKVRT